MQHSPDQLDKMSKQLYQALSSERLQDFSFQTTDNTHLIPRKQPHQRMTEMKHYEYSSALIQLPASFSGKQHGFCSHLISIAKRMAVNPLPVVPLSDSEVKDAK